MSSRVFNMGIVYDVRRKAQENLGDRVMYKTVRKDVKPNSKRKSTTQLTRVNRQYLSNLGFQLL